MNTINELEELVKKKGYGTSQYTNINGDAVYLSCGAREVFLQDKEAEQQLIAIVTRFQNRDYGDAAKNGKEEREGHEYGRYDLGLFEETKEDSAVWVHKTENALIVFFKFER